MTANPRLDVLRNMLDMSMRQAALGAQIREARKEKKWKQRELAAQIPGRDGTIDSQTVSRWERGEHQPDLETLEIVAQVLGKPLSYFFPEEVTADVPPATIAQAAVLLAEAATELKSAAADFRKAQESLRPQRKEPARGRH